MTRRGCFCTAASPRAFQRTFVLADGVEVAGAGIENGLLHIDLHRDLPDRWCSGS